MAKTGTGGLFHSVPPGMKPKSVGGSAKTFQPVGSTSRPVKSVHPIESSAPMDAHTMGRDVPGSLK